MKLNYNSFSAKLYRWFYGGNKMPSSLCPYFWKLVVCYILALPLFILSFPYSTYELIWGDNQFREENIFARTITSLFICFVVGLALFIIMVMLSPVMLLFVEPVKHSFLSQLLMGSCVFWFVGFPIVSVVFLHGKYKERKLRKKYDNNDEKTPNIVVEMVKAKYHKYCPKIDWKK